jgi:hypothetical protein
MLRMHGSDVIKQTKANLLYVSVQFLPMVLIEPGAADQTIHPLTLLPGFNTNYFEHY